MNKGNFWTEGEIKTLTEAWKKKPDHIEKTMFAEVMAKRMDRTSASVGSMLRRLTRQGALDRQFVNESPYPVYNEPLVMEGDAVILPDLEIPFHNAEFTNRVLDLADTWKIRQCILAGDVLHFDSLSGWEPNWTAPNEGGITGKAEAMLTEFAKSLSPKKQGELFGLIGEIGERKELDGVSTELDVARRELKGLNSLFDKVHFLLGNHEGRLLRALETAVNPTELLNLLKQDKWSIAPYYYSYLDTVRGRFQIEHPKGSAEGTAQSLAAKYHAHLIMGHSHLLDYSWDISGKYHAIHAGHLVDENRLAYCGQRHNTKRMHKPGAVIVRDGFPWLLFEGIPWERMKHV